MTPRALQQVFVGRVREMAARAGLDLPELARLAGLEPQRFQSYLDGTAEASVDDVAAVAAALKVDPAELVEDE